MIKTIIKGMHRPICIVPPFLRNMRIRRNRSHIINYDFLINDTYEYLIGGEDQMDWNKMYGWSFGMSHHKNSVRIVWRYNPKDKSVEFAPYAYINGKMILPSNELIVRGAIGDNIRTSIEVLGDTVNFVFSGCEKKPLFGLWMYFGGNRTAPHDIRIQYVNG